MTPPHERPLNAAANAARNAVRDARTPSVVAALIDEGLVVPVRREQAVTVVDRVLGGQEAEPGPVRRRLAELAGYVGGAFVVSAGAIFSAARWDGLGWQERVGLLAGVAALLGVAGLALAGAAGGRAALRAGTERVRRRLAGALLTGAAACAAGAAGLLVDERVASAGSAAGLAGFGTLALLSLLGYVVAPTVLGQLGVAVGAAGAVPLLLDMVAEVSAADTGLCILALGLAWLLATERGWWREPASARVVGSGLAVLGAQLPVIEYDDGRWVGYLATALVAVAAFLVYAARPAWPYLLAGVVSVTLVVPEALLDWTDDALGPAGVLLVSGLTLLGAAFTGLRLRREVGQAPGLR